MWHGLYLKMDLILIWPVCYWGLSYVNSLTLLVDDTANDQLPIDNYLRYEWHPHSKRNPEIVDLATGQHFDETMRQPTKPKLSPSKCNLPGDTDSAPWAPFPTESDFEFAERVATSHMTNSDIKKELDFWLRRAIHGEGALKMQTRTVQDIRGFIQSAVDIHTKVYLVIRPITLTMTNSFMTVQRVPVHSANANRKWQNTWHCILCLGSWGYGMDKGIACRSCSLPGMGVVSKENYKSGEWCIYSSVGHILHEWKCCMGNAGTQLTVYSKRTLDRYLIGHTGWWPSPDSNYCLLWQDQCCSLLSAHCLASCC